MAPLEIPEDLEDVISKFVSIEVRDNKKLQSYSEVAELISAYVRNMNFYANYPRDTREFAERVNKSLKTLDIHLEMTAYNEAFGQCAKQWKDTMEQVADSITDLMKSLEELRIRAANTSKPVTAKETKQKALTVKPLLTGTNQIGTGEVVTIVGEAFGKSGFVRFTTAGGDRAVVPLINLTSSGENTELLTFFMSSVEKMKQCLDRTRKEVTAKFWALARSYFQSRSKQDFVTIVDSKNWKMATDILLKMEDNSTGFSFRSCINGILANAVSKSVRGAFEISVEETEGLHELISSHQWIVQLLSQSSNILRAVDKIWGEDWQKSLLQIYSLQLQSQKVDGQGILQGFTGQTSQYQHLQVFQQHTSKRFVTSSNSYEMTMTSSSEQQQQQHSHRSMHSIESALQQTHGRLEQPVGELDIHRVPSRRSSITSDSGKWQQQQRGSTTGSMQITSSPLPSPIHMSARLESRESRRAVMDDCCSYETRQSDVSVMTDSVSIVSNEELFDQREQLQEARRLLIRMETSKAQTTEAASQTITDSTDSVAKEQKSVRFSLTQPLKPKTVVIDAGCYGDLIMETSWASIARASEERLVVCRTDAQVIGATSANKEVSFKESSVEYKEPSKPLATTGINVSPGKAPITDCGASLAVRWRNSLAIFQETPKAMATTGIIITPEKTPITDCGASLEVGWRNSLAIFQETPKAMATTGIIITPKKTPITDCGASLAVSWKNSSAIFQEIPKAMATTGIIITPDRTPITDSGASLEVGWKNSSAIFQEIPKAMATSNARIGKELLCGRVNFRAELSHASVAFRQERPAVASSFASKVLEQVTQSAGARIDYRVGSCRATVAMVTHKGVKFRPDTVTNTMKSLGKPIVDNGVFRINEMIDSWTDMPVKKPAESGAHHTVARRDVRTQKDATRPPQIECGVGANLDDDTRRQPSRNVEAASVQTTQSGRTVECGAIGTISGAGESDKRRKTRGTDMSDRHTICDTGVCASTKQIAKIQREDLEIRRQQRSTTSAPPPPPPPPKPAPPAKTVVNSGAFGQSAEAGLTVTDELESSQRSRHQSHKSPPPPPPKPAPPAKTVVVVDSGASGQSAEAGLTVTARVESRQQQKVRQQSVPLDSSETTIQRTEIRTSNRAPPPQPHIRTKSEDLPDKEWRFPISRKDIRQGPQETQSSHPTQPPRQPTRQRQFSLPKQQKRRQQQPKPETAAGMDSMQTRVEPGAWVTESRQHWSSRSMHVSTRPASSSSNQRSIRSQVV